LNQPFCTFTNKLNPTEKHCNSPS